MSKIKVGDLCFVRGRCKDSNGKLVTVLRREFSEFYVSSPDLYAGEELHCYENELVLANWAVWIKEPPISDFYKCDQTTAANVRLLKAVTFLKNQELQFPILNSVTGYDVVEQHFKNKVVTYAAAFVEGATNGGELYYNARACLLTWYAIFNGAVFRNGYLVGVGE